MQMLNGLGGERSKVVAEYKRRGGNLDRPDVSLLCHSLTAVEDRIEMERNGQMTNERLRLRTVRRRLEEQLT